MRIESALKDALRPLTAYVPHHFAGPSWRRSLKMLARQGFCPRTVFDIGVGFGTYDLYRAYPKAYYYLVDPTAESLPYMQRIARRLNGEILHLALGDSNTDTVIEIRSDIQGSTLFEEYGPREVLRHDKVAMRRFDTLIGRFQRPALCKIDVQGAEMLVLNGMTERISEIDVFIVEISTIATVMGGPELRDVVSFMNEHGFVVFDVLGIKRRPLDGAPAQLDVMFVSEGSSLRADRRWGIVGSTADHSSATNAACSTLQEPLVGADLDGIPRRS